MAADTCGFTSIGKAWYLLEDMTGRKSDEDFNDLLLRTNTLFSTNDPGAGGTTTWDAVAIVWEGLKVGSRLDHQINVALGGLAAPYLKLGSLIPADWADVDYNCVITRLADLTTSTAFTGALSTDYPQSFVGVPSTYDRFHPPGVGRRRGDANEYWSTGSPACQGAGGAILTVQLEGFLTNNADHPEWTGLPVNQLISPTLAIQVPRTGALFFPNAPVPDSNALWQQRFSSVATHFAMLDDSDDSSQAWVPVPEHTPVFPEMYGTTTELIAQLTSGLVPNAFKAPTAALTNRFVPAAVSPEYTTLVNRLTAGC